jgi:acyl-CoA thioesterase-2
VEARSDPVGDLLHCLALEPLDRDLFLGDPGPGSGRLFGGMVAAQCVMAAGRTVEGDRSLHSLHGYFLRPGSHDVPLRLVVHRIRDGRSFTTRRVVAHQNGEAIFNLAASFAVPEDGIEHQDEMPKAPPPEECEDWEHLRAKLFGHDDVIAPSAIEVRMVDPVDPMTPLTADPVQRAWMRARAPLPDDPLIHTATLVYATDRTLLSTAARPHAIPWRERMAASLDHAVWIHRPIMLTDEWILYAAESPAAFAARGLIFGGLFRPNGDRLASVAQEGLIRRKRK